MSQQAALALASGAIITGAKIAAPIILAAMAVGLVVSLFQSVTQIQEMTLTFVPKVIVISLVLSVSGHWMLGQFVGYVNTLFQGIPTLLGSG
jgi:flagellar biosynthetic protein FliQ